jgi:feruloyl esterase
MDYHRSVVDKLGQSQTDSFVRTFMVPGLQHCSGGPGATSFGLLPGLPPTEQDPTRNMSAAIARWVEQGIAPSTLVATKFKGSTPAEGIALTRLLCPYPAIARYKGAGSSDDSANYTCSVTGR